MQQTFNQLVSALFDSLPANELLLANFYAESSDFIRFNNNRVRQAGHVEQAYLSITLIMDQRQCSSNHSLSGIHDTDLLSLQKALHKLRENIHHLPEDPFLNVAMEVNTTSHTKEASIPDSQSILEQIIVTAEGIDLVGIWASGPGYRGFANSLGQTNWHQQSSFHFDWSCYADGDKAVKLNYAGFDWQADTLKAKMREAQQNLTILKQQPKSIPPGRYHTYLAPRAVREIIDMMSWGGFGLKSHRSSQSALLKLSKNELHLSESFTLDIKPQQGLEPCFTAEGFIKPETLTLIEKGQFANYMIGSRSAREYHKHVNSGAESPQTLQLSTGDLSEQDVLAELGTGIYINDLWYCNFSDRNQCRITGMTRFACFWVEKGKIQAPLNVMRFDDSVFSIFGEQLLALTTNQETLINSGSYGRRSSASYQLPGVLLKQFNLSF